MSTRPASSLIAVTALLLTVNAGFAQTSPASAKLTTAALDQASRQMETVCKAHEEQGRYAAATRCYDQVARSLAVPAVPRTLPRKMARAKSLRVRPAPTKRVARQVRRIRIAQPVATGPNPPFRLMSGTARPGCSNLLCAGFVLLGVGF